MNLPVIEENGDQLPFDPAHVGLRFLLLFFFALAEQKENFEPPAK